MGETYLYRHFGEGGVLLYVGISLSAVARLARHYDGSHWSSQIRSVTIEAFPDRPSAMRGERAAVVAESPLHNIKLRRRVVEKTSRPPSRRGRPAKGVDASLTVERRKPWLALNWSRAKWYRKLAANEVSRFDDELPG